jgi:hypothetical protein
VNRRIELKGKIFIAGKVMKAKEADEVLLVFASE